MMGIPIACLLLRGNPWKYEGAMNEMAGKFVAALPVW